MQVECALRRKESDFSFLFLAGDRLGATKKKFHGDCQESFQKPSIVAGKGLFSNSVISISPTLDWPCNKVRFHREYSIDSNRSGVRPVWATGANRERAGLGLRHARWPRVALIFKS